MSDRVRIIAEAGVNHNGSVDLAFQLVDVASAAGADVVKFQTFNSTLVTSRAAETAEYQRSNTGVVETQLDMIRKLELGADDFRTIRDHCNNRGITFLSTPFDLESLAYLDKELAVAELKISSGEITNGQLLLAAARTGKPVILSTGMTTLGEIETALCVLAFGYLGTNDLPSMGAFKEAYRLDAGQAYLRANVTLLHCTTEYPAPLHEVNLRAMDTMASAFGLPVGYSDHTQGIAVAIAAVARGATIIEKHFTLDRTLPGPDHKASLEPPELAALVAGVREATACLGSPLKGPCATELKNMSIARRSLLARVPIAVGDMFTEDNLIAKRPGSGMSPMDYWTLLGRRSRHAYAADDLIGEDAD